MLTTCKTHIQQHGGKRGKGEERRQEKKGERKGKEINQRDFISFAAMWLDKMTYKYTVSVKHKISIQYM